jgi:LCP family protein required for cell wall assembly
VTVSGVAGGYYLWLDAKVSTANERVPEDVWVALADDPTTTSPPTSYLAPESTTTTEPTPESPEAMNILLVGSDRRSKSSKYYGLSDTIMLVHVDPENDYLSILSLPRDLRVKVAGYGTQRINAAYSYGGPALTIRTVQEVTGVDIDHYLGVDFQAFRDMTDSLGGVYVEVDRRYYYAGASYEGINLQPGFQLLDGHDALDYVRFRHDRNLDFGRMERQQRFLNALREQAMGWDLAFKLPGLIGAFFDNVATDLGTNDFLKLTWWGIRLDGGRVRQVTLRGSTQTIAGASYVVCSDEQIATAVNALLTVPGAEEIAGGTVLESAPSTTTTVATPDLNGVEVDVLNASAGPGEAAATGQWLRGLRATVVTVDNTSEDVAATVVRYPVGMSSAAQKVASVVGTSRVAESGLVVRVTVVLGSDFALPAAFATADTIPDSAIWRGLAEKVPFAVMAPAHIPNGYAIYKRSPNNATIYSIRVGDEQMPAYVMLYKRKGADQYMNLTGTTWLGAPAASAGREVTRAGVVFTIVGNADGVERVWWQSYGVLYWVSNTLSRLASEEEMLAMAESTILVPAQ